MLAGTGQAANIIGQNAAIQQAAGAQQTGAGMAQQANYLGALTDQNTSQLAANQKSEDQRQAMARENHNRKFKPIRNWLNS